MLHDEVKEALDQIDLVTKNFETQLAAAKQHLTDVVAKAFTGKKIVLLSAVEAKAEAKAAGQAVRDPVSYDVTGTQGLYVQYNNRAGKPCSAKYDAVQIAG